MKQLINKTIQLCALLIAFAVTSHAEESKRGFYEGNLGGGGKIVFFVQANHSLSAYLFDVAGQQASFAGGPIAANGTFAVTTSANQPLSGTVSQANVTATYLGQTVTANPAPVFGPTDHFAGRFTGVAESSTGASLDVKVVVDSQGNIFLVTKQGSTILGGFGTVTVTPKPSPSPSASPSPSPSPSSSPHSAFAPNESGPGGGGDDDPSPTPSPSATASPSPGASPSPSASPGDDDGDHDGDDDDNGGDRRRHDGEDQDEAEDHHEDRNAESFNATFTVTLLNGQTVTGHLVFSHGLLLGDLTFNGVVYNFRAPQQSTSNHLANISTRGLVGTGQGQLIGGFIITGGPKMVIIRAMGPSLEAQGVSPALQDPKLQLFNGETVVRENDNWASAANASQVTASGVAPTNANESALMIRLEPGFYTTVVSGVNNTTGIALVEVYEVDRD
jgi:hypothetical protein